MEEGEDLDSYNEEIDDFYVVDSWSEKSNPNFKSNSFVGNNILSKEDKLSRRKPTEGEIDAFLENIKQSNSKCGTSGLKGSICNSFDSGNMSGNLVKIPEGSNRDKICAVINEAAKQSPEPVKRFKHSTVSYKPGETRTETFFTETSVNDLSRSINNIQEIGIPSSDSLFHVSFDRNEDSRGGFSDLKGSQCLNGPRYSTTMECSSKQLRRDRSRSPYASSSSKYPPVRENIRFPFREGGRNHSHLDTLRTNRSGYEDRRHYDDKWRNRQSRSRSRERKHHRRSYERRPSLSPSPKRESGKQSSMETRQVPPYYSSSGAPMPPHSSYMNPDPNLGMSAHGPVQYPLNPVSSSSSYGRYPGYNVPANNLFTSSHTQPQSFQASLPQNGPQNQYPDPQNYNSYNPVIQGNLSNSVSYPAPWNQSSAGFNQNYSVPNLSTDAVMYPHLKIGQSREDSYKNSQRESLGGSPLHKKNKSSLEKRTHSPSRSPDSKKHKKKPSKKRHSKSPSLDHKYEDSNKRYARHSKSPVRTLAYDSKKPKVIIDPNRIPTPPPPPIVGSYKKDDSKKPIEQKVKTIDGKSDVHHLTDFLNKEKVSLSCLLEAVMETSGQGKSQLSDPKVKKEIISNCESKIQHLYKRRMTGLGAFIPDPVQSSRVITHVSPLVTVYSPFTYNCEEENNDWHCPDIIVPEVIIKEDLKVATNDFTTSQLPFEASDKHVKTNIENPTTIPTLSNKQILPELNWNAETPEHLHLQVFPNAYGNNNQNMFSSHQGPQSWSNPVHPQNPYLGQTLMPVSTNEYPNLGPTPYIPPSSYPFPHRPAGPQFMPQPSYPPQPEMLNYPTRMDYPPVHHFPPQNLNHPGMFSAPQPDTNRNNYQYKADETSKLRKNKNMLNDNLILLSRPTVSQNEIKRRNQNNDTEDTYRENRDKIPTDNPKDKLLRKVWRLRKSSEYDNAPIDPPGTKEPKNEFYSQLNYAEMLEDTQLDKIHDYQLTNLRERIETCLAEGKSSPGLSQHKSRDRERDRHKDRDRGRDKARDYEHPRRGSMEGERRYYGRSPHGDERKKRRSVEGHENRRKSKEPSDRNDHYKISSRDDVIEILSDEDHNKQKLSESCRNERLMDPDDHLKPSEKTLISQIFDSLGPEIRKIQEKSDLYKSIIDTLDKGDKAYKRLYSFRNHALMKSEKDNRMKMVIPRDNLKEVITLIHKNFHHVQSEELSRLLKNISCPYMLYIPKCVSKVMSECLICIEERKKNDDPIIDKKSESTERKSEKRNNRSLKDRDKDRRNSPERFRRVSKDRSSSSSSKGRRDPLKSGREKDRKDLVASDGRPSGYEKATKVRKPGLSSNTKSNKITSDDQNLEEKFNLQNDVKSSEMLHGLSDKALEFKHISDSVIGVSEDRTDLLKGFNQQSLSGLDKKDCKNMTACCEVSKNDSEDKDPESKIKSSDLVLKPEMEPSVLSINLEMEPSSLGTKPEIESSNAVSKYDVKCSNTVTKTEMESSSPVTNSQVSKELDSSISESVNSSKLDLMDKNQKPNDSTSDVGFHVSKQSNMIGAESKEVKVSLDQKDNDVDRKAAPKLDFKGRVRQVQMSSNECKNIMMALETSDYTIPADPSYLIKGGMLCRKDITGNNIEVKIVTPSDELEKVVNIVHTMSATHTPPVKVVAFFSKHFTQVENLDLKVNEIVGKCANCKLKSS